jgi:peroxiredoxin
MRHTVPVLLLVACFAPMVGRGGPIGEPAAPLVVKEWIRGKPVEVKAGTNIVVVEIFTTASLASRASITNLNALQRRFKDQGVVVVGISDEPPERLKGFVADAGSAIEYAVGADSARKTTLNYMMPVGKRGVPYSFVVGKDGKLLWHGHPREGLAEALEQITAGRYNVELAAKIELSRTQLGQYLNLVRKGDPRAAAAGQEFLSRWTNDVARLCDLAQEIATEPKIARRDFALANQALDRAAQLAPTNSTRVAVAQAMVLFESGKKQEGQARAREAVAAAHEPEEKAYAQASLRNLEGRLAAASTNAPAQIDPARIRLEQSAKQYFSLARRNDPKAGVVGRELLGMLTNDVVQLCDLALGIATDRRIASRDLTLAGEALAQAEKVAPTNSTRVAVTRAVILFETSDKKEEALAQARAALASSHDPKEKAYAQRSLDTMQSRQQTLTLRQKRDYAKQYLILAKRSDPQAQVVGRKLVGMLTNDPVQLCSVAIGITTDPGITNRDLALAGEAVVLAEKVAPKNSPRVAATQAVVLFESGGKQEECLARAREAFASAPEDSQEKAYAETCLRFLERQMEAARTNQTSAARLEAAKTNQTSNPAAK